MKSKVSWNLPNKLSDVCRAGNLSTGRFAAEPRAEAQAQRLLAGQLLGHNQTWQDTRAEGLEPTELIRSKAKLRL